MRPDTEEEKLPTLSLHEISSWGAKITDYLSPTWIGVNIAGDAFKQVVAGLVGVIDPKAKKVATLSDTDEDPAGKLYKAVARTVESLVAGKVMDVATARHMAIRIAGNLSTLRFGTPVADWDYQRWGEWVIGMVEDGTPYTTPKKHISGTMFQFKIMSGLAAGESFTQFMPESMMYRMASRFGLRTKRDRRSVHPRELVRMYTALYIPEGAELKTEKYKERGSLNKRNTELAEYRAAYKQSCPNKFKWACHFCHIGYDICCRGTHAKTYELKTCAKGHKGWMHPKQRSGICIHCKARKWLATH